MKVADIIGACLCGAAIICLIALVTVQYAAPHYGECYIDEQGYEHCSLGFLKVISTEAVQ